MSNWKTRIRDQAADEARNLDPFPMLGATLKHFEALRASQWQLINDPSLKAADRTRAADVALRVTAEEQRTLKDWGFLTQVKIMPKRGSDLSAENAEAEELKDMIASILTGAVDVASAFEDPEQEPGR